MDIFDDLPYAVHVIIRAVKDAGEFLHSLAAFNYKVVSCILQILHSIFRFIGTTCTWIVNVIVEGAIYIQMFVCELGIFLYTCLFFVWSALTSIYNLFVMLISAIEISISFFIHTICTCFILLYEGLCSLTAFLITSVLYIRDSITNGIHVTFGGFSAIGTFTTESIEGVCRAITDTVIFAYVWLFTNMMYVCYSVLDFITYSFWSMLPRLSRETYLGILVCCLAGILLSNLYAYMQSRGLSIPFGRTRGALVLFNDVNVEPDPVDSDDGSSNVSVDEDDDDVSDEVSDDSEDNSTLSNLTTNDDSEEISDESTDLTDNNDTDSEIDIELPRPGEPGYNLRSRNSTARVLSDDLSKGDFEREIEKERDKRMCVVCQEQQKNVLILPCKHVCLCIQCAQQIVKAPFIERRNCPLCRSKINKVMNVFV